MAGRPIERDKNMPFLGAGFSKAARLPNTNELLSYVDQQAKRFRARLEEEDGHFYPEQCVGFQPEAYTGMRHITEDI
jgi:hypothetical protein